MKQFRVAIGNIIGIVFIVPAFICLIAMAVCAIPVILMIIIVVVILPAGEDITFCSQERNWEGLEHDHTRNKKTS